MSLRTSRARGELLCASTKSARSLSFGEAVPASSFSSIGMACSGAWCCKRAMAMSFRSSSAWSCGRTGWPALRRTSASSARACFQVAALGVVASQRRNGRQRFGALARADPARRPSSRAPRRLACPFMVATSLNRSTARSQRASSRARMASS